MRKRRPFCFGADLLPDGPGLDRQQSGTSRYPTTTAGGAGIDMAKKRFEDFREQMDRQPRRPVRRLVVDDLAGWNGGRLDPSRAMHHTTLCGKHTISA